MSAKETEFSEEIREIEQRKPDALTWSSTIIDFVADFFKISTVFTAIFTILSDTYPEPNEHGEHEPEPLSIGSWQILLALVFAAFITPGTAYANTVINTSGQSSENTPPTQSTAETLEVTETDPLLESNASSAAQLSHRDKTLLILSYLGETFNMAGGFVLTLSFLYSKIYSDEAFNKTTDILFLLFSLIASAVGNLAITRTAWNNIEHREQIYSEEEPIEDKTSKADFFTNVRAVVHFLSDFFPSTVFFSTLFSLTKKTTDIDHDSTGQKDNFELFAWSNLLGATLALLLTTANVATDWFINRQGQSETQSTPPQNIEDSPFESSTRSAAERSTAYVCALALVLGLSYCSELSETAGVYWLIEDFLAELISPHWKMGLSIGLTFIFGDIVLGGIKGAAFTRTAKINIEKALESSSSAPSSNTGWLSWFSSGGASAQTSEIPAQQPSYAASCLSWLSSTASAAASSTSSCISNAWRRCTGTENSAPRHTFISIN